MTFENNQIDYKLEIKTLKEYMQKADSLEKYDNLIESVTMLLLNSLNAEEKWQSAIRGTLWEINRI